MTALDNLKLQAGVSGGRQFVAAVLQKATGKVKIVWADGGEPLADVVAALTEVGVQPEALDALSRKTIALEKARKLHYGAIIAAADQLRAACGDDDTFTRIVSGELVLSDWNGYIAKGVMVTKGVKHDGRQGLDGKFTAMTNPHVAKIDGIPWRVQDTRTGIGWALDGGVHPPADDGTQNVRPEDGHPGDNAGRTGKPLKVGKFGLS